MHTSFRILPLYHFSSLELIEESSKRIPYVKDLPSTSIFSTCAPNVFSSSKNKCIRSTIVSVLEAEGWLRSFLVTQQVDFNILFEDFLKIYYSDMEARLREHTLRTKRYIIDLKVLPYFGKMKMNEIKATDIRKWQNELMHLNIYETVNFTKICTPVITAI